MQRNPDVKLSLSRCQQRRRQSHPTPVLLPGKSHRRRSLVGCSPWGREESDTTERLPFHFHALKKEMATHSSVLAWRIPGTGEPGRLPSMGSHRVGHDWSDLAAAAAAGIWQNKNYNFAIVALKLHLYCLQNFKIFFNIYLFNKLCIFIITIIQNCWYCYKHNFMPNWNLHSQGQSKLIYIYFLFLLLGYKLMDGKNRVSLLNY